MLAPVTVAEKFINKSRHIIVNFILTAIIFSLAGLSALPYLYLTHKTFSNSLGLSGALLFDIQAFLAPTLVNSWALSYVLKVFHTSLKDWKNKLLRKKIVINDIHSPEFIKFQLRSKILKAIRVIELLKRADVKILYDKIYDIDNTEKMIRIVKNASHAVIYQKSIESIQYLTNPNKIIEQPHAKISPNKPRTRTILGILGAIIGGTSAYQYLGNGKDAAIWLHAPGSVAVVIGIASLICNAALGVLTNSIVFEEFYIWLTKVALKIKAMLGFAKSHMHRHIPKFSEIFTSLSFRSSTYANLFFIVKLLIAMIAISAATPNVYLTLQQTAGAPMTILTQLLLVCSFIGPFATNFYAISKVIEQNSRRQIILDALLKLLDTIEEMKFAHAKALLKIIVNEFDQELTTVSVSTK